MMAMDDADNDMLMGAKPIARAYWGDEKHFRRVYPNVEQLPLFHYRGLVCAFKSALEAHKAAVASQKRALAQQMAKAAAQATLMPLSPPAKQMRGVVIKPRQRRQRETATT